MQNPAIETLEQFYSVMAQTCRVRRQAVRAVLDEQPVTSGVLQSLDEALESLVSLPGSPAAARVSLDGQSEVELELGYETGELRKDLLFLQHGEDKFEKTLSERYPAYQAQVEAGVQLLKQTRLRNFISDRDGTVNNYCGRYLSSVQSVYNAVFLARFAKRRTQNAVLLTSAPLDNGGLVDVSTLPDGTFLLAGSKGREYFGTDGRRTTFPVEPRQQQLLDKLNQRLVMLLDQPSYRKYGLIGSGLQRKFGQTTIARQDISTSVAAEESAAFLETVRELVRDVDPSGADFRIEDTGLDIEVILTVTSDSDGSVADFSKADGTAFLDRSASLGVAQGPNLVCGDTSSDVPMVSWARQQCQDTCCIFVTKDQALRDRVLAACPGSLIVDEPDTLVSILNRASRDLQA